MTGGGEIEVAGVALRVGSQFDLPIFGQMKKLMRQVSQGKMPSLQQLAGGR